MTTRLDIRTKIKRKLNMSDTSTLYTDTQLNEAIKDAEIWSYREAMVQSRERAKETATVSGDYYYDYPTDAETNSVKRLTIDGKEYAKKNFEDYLQFRTDYPDSEERYFADYGRQYFVTPIPTADDLEILVWVESQNPAMSSDTDTTYFSYHSDEKNEAIVEKVLSDLKGEGINGKHYVKAKNILEEYMEEINDENYRDHHIDRPQFVHIDFYK